MWDRAHRGRGLGVVRGVGGGLRCLHERLREVEGGGGAVGIDGA